MGAPIDYFHKRLTGIEKTLSEIRLLLEKSNKRSDALEHRIEKLEKKAVGIEATVARYMRRRISADNGLRRWFSSVTFEQFEQADRLKAIEQVGFPHLSADVERVLGKTDVAAGEALDCRKSKPKR